MNENGIISSIDIRASSSSSTSSSTSSSSTTTTTNTLPVHEPFVTNPVSPYNSPKTIPSLIKIPTPPVPELFDDLRPELYPELLQLNNQSSPSSSLSSTYNYNNDDDNHNHNNNHKSILPSFEYMYSPCNDIVARYYSNGLLELTLYRSKALNALTREIIQGFTYFLDIANSIPTLDSLPTIGFDGSINLDNPHIKHIDSDHNIYNIHKDDIVNSLDITSNTKNTTRIRRIDAIIITSAIPKAYCAGGDVVKITNPDNIENSYEFFTLEYFLHQKIICSSIPVISLLRGYTLGGGVGISIHTHIRLVSDTVQYGMPETKIGYIPDIAATYFLPRWKHNIGLYLALSSNIASIGDVLQCGIATHFIPSRVQGGDDDKKKVMKEVKPAKEMNTMMKIDSCPKDTYTQDLNDILSTFDGISLCIYTLRTAMLLPESTKVIDEDTDTITSTSTSTSPIHDLTCYDRMKRLLQILEPLSIQVVNNSPNDTHITPSSTSTSTSTSTLTATSTATFHDITMRPYFSAFDQDSFLESPISTALFQYLQLQHLHQYDPEQNRIISQKYLTLEQATELFMCKSNCGGVVDVSLPTTTQLCFKCNQYYNTLSQLRYQSRSKMHHKATLSAKIMMEGDRCTKNTNISTTPTSTSPSPSPAIPTPPVSTPPLRLLKNYNFGIYSTVCQPFLQSVFVATSTTPTTRNEIVVDQNRSKNRSKNETSTPMSSPSHLTSPSPSPSQRKINTFHTMYSSLLVWKDFADDFERIEKRYRHDHHLFIDTYLYHCNDESESSGTGGGSDSDATANNNTSHYEAFMYDIFTLPTFQKCLQLIESSLWYDKYLNLMSNVKKRNATQTTQNTQNTQLALINCDIFADTSSRLFSTAHFNVFKRILSITDDNSDDGSDNHNHNHNYNGSLTSHIKTILKCNNVYNNHNNHNNISIQYLPHHFSIESLAILVQSILDCVEILSIRSLSIVSLTTQLHLFGSLRIRTIQESIFYEMRVVMRMMCNVFNNFDFTQGVNLLLVQKKVLQGQKDGDGKSISNIFENDRGEISQIWSDMETVLYYMLLSEYTKTQDCIPKRRLCFEDYKRERSHYDNSSNSSNSNSNSHITQTQTIQCNSICNSLWNQITHILQTPSFQRDALRHAHDHCDADTDTATTTTTTTPRKTSETCTGLYSVNAHTSTSVIGPIYCVNLLPYIKAPRSIINNIGNESSDSIKNRNTNAMVENMNIKIINDSLSSSYTLNTITVTTKTPATTTTTTTTTTPETTTPILKQLNTPCYKCIQLILSSLTLDEKEILFLYHYIKPMEVYEYVVNTEQTVSKEKETGNEKDDTKNEKDDTETKYLANNDTDNDNEKHTIPLYGYLHELFPYYSYISSKQSYSIENILINHPWTTTAKTGKTGEIGTHTTEMTEATNTTSQRNADSIHEKDTTLRLVMM